MGARFTIGLMIVAAAALVVGYLTRTSAIIYVSIACSLIAVVGLLISARKRPGAQGADGETWARSLADTTETAANPVVVTKGRGRKARSSGAVTDDVPKASTDADDGDDSEANKAYEELLATSSGRRDPDVDDTDPGLSQPSRRRGPSRVRPRAGRMRGESDDTGGEFGDDEADDLEDYEVGVRVHGRRGAESRPRAAGASGTRTTARRSRIDDDAEEEDTRVLSRTSPRAPTGSAVASEWRDEPVPGRSDRWSEGEPPSPRASSRAATADVPSARSSSAPTRSATRRVGGPGPDDVEGPVRRPRRIYSDDPGRSARRTGQMDLPDDDQAARRRGPVDLSDERRPSRRRGPVDVPEDQRPARRRGPAEDVHGDEQPSRGPGAPPPARPAVRAAAPFATTARREPPRRQPQPPPSDYPFPIEDYDELRVEEIMPLLPQLYDEELVEVFLHERDGAHRRAILDRLDELLEGS